MSVGYLLAAFAVTVIGLAGYGMALAQRLASARERHRELRASTGVGDQGLGG